MKTKASTPLHQVTILRRRSEPLSNFGIIFTHILFAKGEKIVTQGLIFHSSIRFCRFMPKGEKLLAQSKRTAPPSIFKKSELRKDFSIGDFSIGILLLIEFQIGTTLFKTNIQNPLEH